MESEPDGESEQDGDWLITDTLILTVINGNIEKDRWKKSRRMTSKERETENETKRIEDEFWTQDMPKDEVT